MNIDYSTLEQDVEDGTFRQRLEEELTLGFRQIHDTGALSLDALGEAAGGSSGWLRGGFAVGARCAEATGSDVSLVL